MRLQIRLPDNSKQIITDLNSSSLLSDLNSIIQTQCNLPFDQQRILVGFPPKQINTENANTSLSDLGLRSGDALKVEHKESKRGIQKAVAGSSLSVFSIPKNKGHFSKREMPSDNSCLFHSVAYTCKDRARGQASAMRAIVVQTVRSKPQLFSSIVLGQSPSSYCSWITNENTWGGAIELNIFASYFETEIIAFDAMYLREDVYGENASYSKRCFVLYSSSGTQQQGQHSAHYDALVFSPFGNACESDDKVLFGTSDHYAWERARNYVEHLHKEACAKDSSIPMLKKWRRSKSGVESAPSIGYSLGATHAPSIASSDKNTLSSDQWECRTCTFHNNVIMPTCEMCGKAK